jgi:UDP-2,3-diacylglucosamine pyrophosphatase LpxH
VTTASKRIGLETFPLRYPWTAEGVRRTYAFRRLTEVFKASRVIPFDDSSRFIFFSDLHRGDDSRADAFAGNKELFLGALTHYYHKGFTYVEVGDGDELWKNQQFSDILRAHASVFDLLHMFEQRERLHIIVGNHDIQNSRHQQVEKDGILAEEGLVLRHAKTGQKIFVVHGHQADYTSDRLSAVSRFMVRHVWKRLQVLGLVKASSPSRRIQERTKMQIEGRIIEWVQAYRHIVICGHTHHPRFTGYGATPYFNTGSCVYSGYITGIEIQDGELALVKWTHGSNGRLQPAPHIRRELLAPPQMLKLFG